ncbi:MAG: glycosyltransferase [Promethearchaeota archaeon]
MESKNTSKFLYIAASFPPLIGNGGLRALEFSLRLIENNIFPIILTRKKLKNEMIHSSFIKRIPRSLNIVRAHVLNFSTKTFRQIFTPIFRFDYYFDWLPFAYKKGKKILRKDKNIEFIFATGPPFSTFIIAYYLKKKFKIPLIVEYRDPWSYYPYIKKNEQKINKKVDLRYEKKILKSADVIITVCSELNLFLINKFPFIKNKPIYEIANGLNLKEIVETPLKRKSNEVIFTFTGKLYGIRTIVPLLKIISDLKKEGYFKDFKFTLKIFGSYRENLPFIIKELEIQDLIYLGSFIQRLRVFEELSKCDLAVHIGENFNYPTLAFKVWDYLSMGKKILYLGLNDSYTAKFLKETNFGITIPLNNLKKGKSILRNLLNDIRNKKFVKNINKEEIIQFEWEKKAEKFLEIISKHIYKK